MTDELHAVPRPSLRRRGFAGRVGRGLAWLLGTVVTLAIALVALGWVQLLRAMPQVDGTVKVAGLTGSVQVVRDRYGVPSITAATDADAYRALGYVHAQDRFYQMEMSRHFASGTVSSVVGRAGIDLDRQMRTFGIARAAERSLASLQPSTRAALDAYSAGVNAWLDSDPTLPAELQLMGLRFGRRRPAPWRPADSVMLLKLLSLELDGNYAEELRRAKVEKAVGKERATALLDAELPGTPPIITAAVEGFPAHATPQDDIDTSPSKHAQRDSALRNARALARAVGAGAGIGSTSWVIGSTRTRSGKPLLSNDPHLAVSSPSQWYAVRVAGATLHVSGMSMPGLPALVVGRNQHIAWGITAMYADIQDLYFEHVVAGDPTHYLVGDQSLAFEARVEHIEVAGEPNPVELTVRESVHGPIIEPDWEGKGPLALRWTALDGDDTSFDGLLGIGRAESYPAFREALRAVVAPVVNFTYADIEGHIAYVGPGRIPVRAVGDGSLPLDGADPRSRWASFVPFDELPQILDPEEGFIVSANQRVAGAAYPHFLARTWPAPFRAIRIRELVSTKTGVDLDEVARMHADVTSTYARMLRPRLLAVTPKDDAERAALAMLQTWDCAIRADSAAALLYETWRIHLEEGVFVDDLGPELFREMPPAALVQVLADDKAQFCDDRKTPAKETCSDILEATLAASLQELRARYGEPSTWRLDRALSVRFRSRELSWLPIVGRLFVRQRPGWGDNTTVRAFAFNEAFHAQAISSMFADYDLGTGETRASVSLGQSAHALSPHFDDLLPSWERSAPQRLEPVDATQATTLTLAP